MTEMGKEMTRRTFFRAAVAIGASVLVGHSAPARVVPPPDCVRRWYRHTRPACEWVEIEYEDVRAGDEVWVHTPATDGLPEHNEVVMAHDDYDPVAGYWRSGLRIDPVTNQWVPFS